MPRVGDLVWCELGRDRREGPADFFGRVDNCSGGSASPRFQVRVFHSVSVQPDLAFPKMVEVTALEVRSLWRPIALEMQPA
jgi:hypothetical protein